jgi:hypothetical protein
MSGDRALALKFADHFHRAFPEKDFAKDGMSSDEGTAVHHLCPLRAAAHAGAAGARGR